MSYSLLEHLPELNQNEIVVIRSQPDFPEGFNSMLDLLTNLASTSSAMQDLIS